MVPACFREGAGFLNFLFNKLYVHLQSSQCLVLHVGTRRMKTDPIEQSHSVDVLWSYGLILCQNCPLSWFQSYLQDRNYFVSIGNIVSELSVESPKVQS